MKLNQFVKLPSVTPGGKPFFYFNKDKTAWIIWNRLNGNWEVQWWKQSKLVKTGGFTTPEEAAEKVEEILQKDIDNGI